MHTHSLRDTLAYLTLAIGLTVPVQAADLPDLKVTAIRLYAGVVQPGQPITIETTITNRGRARAPASLTGLYLSASPRLAPHLDNLLGGQPVAAGLAPGRSVTQWSTVYVPPGLSMGAAHLGAVADLTKRVHEANETNNKIIALTLGNTHATLHYPCSLEQAFHFKRDRQNTVGYVISLTIGTTPLLADLRLTNPLDPGGEPLAAVGAIAELALSNPKTDPLYLDFAISEANQKHLQQLIHTQLSNTQVTIAITVDAYDPVAKAYYPAVYMLRTDLHGLIAKAGGEYILSVDSQPLPSVIAPLVFTTHLGLTPAGCQPIGMAAAVHAQYNVPWGCPGP